MVGFLLVIANNKGRLEEGKIRSSFDLETHGKFSKDEVYVETDEYLNFLNGIILNKSSFETNSWSETFNKKIEEDPIFFNQLRGSYYGIFWNKQIGSCKLYNDHIGSKPIYYYKNDDVFIASNNISEIYKYLTRQGISYSLDVQSAYMLLSYGYMLDDRTLCRDILKLPPGSYLDLDENFKTSTHQYYRLPVAEDFGIINEREAIEEIDYNFRSAVEAQFSKDKEYNYRNLVALSGGLDSRMTSWVAHDLGYEDQVNFTFSQSGYLDETIAKEISSDLKHEWLFKSLDNGLFLKGLDKITGYSGGNVLYYGIAHGDSFYSLLDFKEFGLCHSGQLGDVAIGSFVKRIDTKDLQSLGGGYSPKLTKKFELDKTVFKTFGELENALIYQRGLNGTNNGLVSILQHTETMSPFYNIDFMECCLKIPIEHRLNHKLYKKWVLEKYPNAGNYIWESIGTKLTRARYVTWRGKKIAINKIPSFLAYKLGVGKASINTKNHMNPLDFWYHSNNELKNFVDDYFYQNIDKIEDRILRSDCTEIFINGNATEKNQVISLLSAIKLFFS